jgi:hypothetical protein
VLWLWIAITTKKEDEQEKSDFPAAAVMERFASETVCPLDPSAAECPKAPDRSIGLARMST